MTDVPSYDDQNYPALDGSIKTNITNNNIIKNNNNNTIANNIFQKKTDTTSTTAVSSDNHNIESNSLNQVNNSSSSLQAANTTVSSSNNSNTNNTTSASANNIIQSSWSSPPSATSTDSISPTTGQQQVRLNYLQHIQQIYHQQKQRQQQHQVQEQHQPQSQSADSQLNAISAQQVLHNQLNSDLGSDAMVSQYQLQPQQPQNNSNNNNISNYSTINNNNNNNSSTMQSNPSIQQKRPGLPNPILSSERCCTFRITPEERRHRDLETEQSRILKDIMLKTNTKIEVTATKDGALNFCIIGKENSLRQAKSLVLNDFQTSVTLTVSVPKSIHGRLLGPKGQRLSTIQDETQTKITIPRKEEDSDIIKIVGLKSNAEMAVRSIQAAAREFAAKAVEKVTVERIYLLFITGPFNENLKRWEEMGAKVSTSAGLMLGNNEREPEDVTFTIVGETTAVGQVKEEIQQIYEDKKKKCTTVNIEVKKAQHKYILGPNGQNLRNLFAKTGVSVELPQESESETITLRGERSKLGPALSELYTQAHSETDDVLEVESWLHKYLIGGRRTNTIDFKARGVDVKSFDNKIKLHGPPTEVENVKDMLEAEYLGLKDNLIRKDIRVEPRIHGYIIGRAGATVDQIREESGAHVLVPKNDEPNEFITLEGTPEAVAIAEVKIDAIAKKYEASRKLVIDQQLHGSIIGRGGEKIRSIREKFSNIIFTFPEQGSMNNDITILGPADEVEECYKYLDEFHKQLQESNHKLQVPIKKEITKYIADAQGAIKRIKLENKVKIDIFINNNETKKGQSSEVPAAKAQAGEAVANNNEGTDTAEGKKKGSKNKGSKKQAQKPDQQAQQQQQPQQVNKNSAKAGEKASGNTDENYALVTGRKEDVDQAKVKLLKLFDELTTTTEFEVKMSHKLRSQLGPRTKTYKMLLDEFQQKIVITFSQNRQQEKQQSGKQSGGDEGASQTTESNGTTGKEAGKGGNNRTEIVKIRGPKQIAKKAEKRFEALIAEAQERMDKNFSASTTVETSVIQKFQYADKIKIGKIRETHNVKLVIPDSKEVPKLQITVTGYEKEVQAALQQFIELYKDVEERTKEVIEIPSQVHPRLIGAQGIVVKKIIDEFKVEVKFARQGDPNPDSVVLIGRPDNIKAARDHMNKLADQYLSSASRANSNSANSSNNNNSQQLASEVSNS